MLGPQRNDGGSGPAHPADLGGGWNEPIEIRRRDRAETLVQGREIVAEPNHVLGVMADGTRGVAARRG